MLHRRFTIVLLLLVSSTAFAQTGTIIDMGVGFQHSMIAQGRSGTIIDLGSGIKSYNDNRGVSGNIIDLGERHAELQLYFTDATCRSIRFSRICALCRLRLPTDGADATDAAYATVWVWAVALGENYLTGVFRSINRGITSLPRI